ncbi:MAG: hypothetical protein QOJ52_837 [Acidimicrobiaceae bacterium]|jgi:hypothetical protein|nr:hypothetical protein [Acidimicrobiaceae bacterium]MDQ1441653.1 hypothetical protein [Acidimicrobiaceae bacterium]
MDAPTFECPSFVRSERPSRGSRWSSHGVSACGLASCPGAAGFCRRLRPVSGGGGTNGLPFAQAGGLGAELR